MTDPSYYNDDKGRRTGTFDDSFYIETTDISDIRRKYEESGGSDWFSVKGATAYEY